MEDLQFIPNINARSIKGFRGKVIGLIVPSYYDDFFSKILEGVLKAAESFGLRVIVFSCHGDAALEGDCLKSAAASGICGLLYCPSAEISAEKLCSIFPKDFPTVIVYRRDMVKGIPHIYHDNINGGYLATKYLLRQGHQNTAFFASFWQKPCDDIDGLLALMNTSKCGAYSSLDRLAGHIKALEENGIPFDKSLLFSIGYGFDNGYKGAKDFLSKMRDFDAVICGNDSVAAGVMQALREQNISVPEQVSLVGYDDSIFATIARPQLTSVRQEPYRLGFESAEMLTGLMQGQTVKDRIIDMQLVVRDSTSVKHNNSNF
ncbi:Catabolite control protein A [bioreactor metagenome]|uniref:Catabolite control protein A n=1 Tax=bioreactor metagenome TaxID=1076179 RepID=A0A645D8C1_9ZZZZ